MITCSVTFLPDNITVSVEKGKTIAEAAQIAGIKLKMPCGGEGSCGKCAVKVMSNRVSDNVEISLDQKFEQVLACQTEVSEDVTVEVPVNARLGEHQVLLSAEDDNALGTFAFEPLCWKVTITLSPPSINENASDWIRLKGELGKIVGDEEVIIGLPLLTNLAHMLRDASWQVTVTLLQQDGYVEVIDLQPGANDEPIYGLAIDIGTTTVVVYLVDLCSGKVLDRNGTYNKQAVYGDDVIARIIHSQEKNGLQELQDAVVNTIDELTNQLLKKTRIEGTGVKAITIAANTIMTHLFLGLDPKYIRLEPYIPTTSQFPAVKATEVGLRSVPNANIYCMPSVGSYVGGDIVAGVLYTGISQKDELTLFIDIGTNGEIVLGNKEWLISCACSAGPAFEGSGITCGMRAMHGAIERIQITPGTYETRYETVEDGKPTGICGSGLIDCIAKLHHVGLLDRAGRFTADTQDTNRIRNNEEGKEFVISWEKEAGVDNDIVITEGDIQNLIRSKGAIFAGIRCLLNSLQIDMEIVDKFYIAGGFGNYLNINDAIEIGLLPDLPHEKYQFVGNTSVKGAYMTLISRSALKAAVEIGRKMTYMELSVGNEFMDEFVSALFLPHTDLSLFPSVQSN
ncbi:ASKHA domain-containing protein [Bacillota bacterium LX-D]|nr:ASKHA domain-containing protein [Bacillota bacterium LX-D]